MSSCNISWTCKRTSSFSKGAKRRRRVVIGRFVPVSIVCSTYFVQPSTIILYMNHSSTICLHSVLFRVSHPHNLGSLHVYRWYKCIQYPLCQRQFASNHLQSVLQWCPRSRRQGKPTELKFQTGTYRKPFSV